MLPPSCRVRLKKPDAAEMSFLGMGPRVAMLSGRNMNTVPKERTMSGQKRSLSPVSGLSLRQPDDSAPSRMQRAHRRAASRGSNLPRSLRRERAS